MNRNAHLLSPEEDLRILREMLTPEMILEPDTGTDGKPRLKLTDSDNPKTCVTITGLLPHTIAVKSDGAPCISRCFQSSRGEAKRSDYILICAGEKERWVVFVELKGSMKYVSVDGLASQLLGSRCFLSMYEQPAGCSGRVRVFSVRMRSGMLSSPNPRGSAADGRRIPLPLMQASNPGTEYGITAAYKKSRNAWEYGSGDWCNPTPKPYDTTTTGFAFKFVY